MHNCRDESTTTENLYWWAGIASVLPLTTAIPMNPNRWINRWNELRWAIGHSRIFPSPTISKEAAKCLAKPTTTGLGDMICAWLMPMTVAAMLGWKLRIPVPRFAGGVRDNPQRPPLPSAFFRSRFNLPSHVELIDAETIPSECEWFCTVEQQWFLNSCMETSFDTIPCWLRSRSLQRADYYDCYRAIATSLLRPEKTDVDEKKGDTPFLALHARRGDKGNAGDKDDLAKILQLLAEDFKHWVVVSDDQNTRNELMQVLESLGCRFVSSLYADLSSKPGSDHLFADFRATVAACGVVCSVRGGWSAFPYAATRISGAPLLFSTEVASARVWRMFRAYSKIPIKGTYLGLPETAEFRLALRDRSGR